MTRTIGNYVKSASSFEAFHLMALQGTSMIGAKTEPDAALMIKIGARDLAAFEKIESRLRNLVFRSIAKLLSGGEQSAKGIFSEIWQMLLEHNLKLITDWDGRGEFDVYIKSIVEILVSRRVQALLADDPRGKGWNAFEDRFKSIIKSKIKKLNFSYADRDDADNDAYSFVCEGFIENDNRRLIACSKSKDFVGYTRRVVTNLLYDYTRKETGTYTLPKAIEVLSDFDQFIFKQIYWYQQPQNAEVLISQYYSSTKIKEPAPKVKPAEFDAALVRIYKAVPPGYTGGSGKPISIDEPHSREISGDDDHSKKPIETIDIAGVNGHAGSFGRPDENLETKTENELYIEVLGLLRLYKETCSEEHRHMIDYQLSNKKPRDWPGGAHVYESLRKQVQRKLDTFLENSEAARKWREFHSEV